MRSHSRSRPDSVVPGDLTEPSRFRKIRLPGFCPFHILIPQFLRGDFFDSIGPNPDFLLGGRTSASAECRHWSGGQSVGSARRALFPHEMPASNVSGVFRLKRNAASPRAPAVLTCSNRPHDGGAVEVLRRDCRGVWQAHGVARVQPRWRIVVGGGREAARPILDVVVPPKRERPRARFARSAAAASLRSAAGFLPPWPPPDYCSGGPAREIARARLQAQCPA